MTWLAELGRELRKRGDEIRRVAYFRLTHSPLVAITVRFHEGKGLSLLGRKEGRKEGFGLATGMGREVPAVVWGGKVGFREGGEGGGEVPG